MLKQLIYISLILVIFFSCKSRKKDDIAIADAFGNTLYLSQAQHYMPSNLSPKDSVDFLKKFSKKWMNQQVLINAINNDDKIDIIEIEEKIENQKNQLIVNEYQKHLIKYSLDTVVDESEIHQFYNENQAIFKLNQTIVNAIYIQVPKENKHLREVNKLLAKSDSASKAALYKYSQEFADTYITTDSNWVTFTDFTAETPFQGMNPEKFVSLVKRTYSTQPDSYSFLKITRSKIKGDIAPFEYYKSNIKNKILTDRKASIFENTQNSLLKSAKQAQEIQSYVK